MSLVAVGILVLLCCAVPCCAEPLVDADNVGLVLGKNLKSGVVSTVCTEVPPSALSIVLGASGYILRRPRIT